MTDYSIENDTIQREQDLAVERERRIQDAAVALAALTPEQYLEMVDYIQNTNSAVSEAPAVAWVKMNIPDIGDISLTVRSVNLEDAIFKLVDTIRQTRPTYGWRLSEESEKHKARRKASPSPSPSKPPQPTQQASTSRMPRDPFGDSTFHDGDEGMSPGDLAIHDEAVEPSHPAKEDVPGTIQAFKVDRLIVQEKDGERYLVVFGGQYTKYGVKAWKGALPKGYYERLDTLEIGKGYIPTAPLAWAWYNPKTKKVIKFAEGA